MDKPPIVVVGQTPPPQEGQAIMISAMIEGLRDRLEVVPVRMAFSASAAEAGAFAWNKVAHLFGLIRRTRAALRRRPEAILYYPPAPARPLAVLRDIVFLSAVRGRARRTVFHFHAAGLADYLRRHAWARAAGRRAFGRPDAAIVQTEEGRADGEAIGARRVAVIPCGRDVPLLRRSRENGPFRIFFAGIHRRSKGIFDAIETLARLRRRGIDPTFPVRGQNL